MLRASATAMHRPVRVIIASPALSLLDVMVELLHLDEVAIELRAEELEPPEVDLLLDLVPGRPRHVPQVVCGLEENVDVPLLPAVGHQLGVREIIARLPRLILTKMYL